MKSILVGILAGLAFAYWAAVRLAIFMVSIFGIIITGLFTWEMIKPAYARVKSRRGQFAGPTIY